MAKFAIVLVAALAFQATFALHTEEQRNNEVQDLLKQVQVVTSDASSAIQNVLPQDYQHIHVLYAQANEFAHNVHDVVYQLQQIFYHNQEGQDEGLLHQVVVRLSEIVHAIEQAMHYEPTELKVQLRNQVQQVAVEARKLAQVTQHEQSTEQVNDEVEDALSTLLAAIEQLQVRNRLQHKTQEEVKSQIQELTNKVSNAIENVKYDDEDTVEAFVHHAHYLAHHIGEIIHKIQKEVHNYDGETQTVLQQVVSKFSEIRASLEQVGYNQEKVHISELKNQLKNYVHSITAQIERLVQLVHSENFVEEDVHHLKDLVESVLARSVVAVRQLQRQVEATVQNHQEN